MSAVWYSLGTALFAATTIALLKVLVVPRRAWSIVASPLLAALVWLFHQIARRLRRDDTADRFLGFLGPLYVVTLLAAFLFLYAASFAILLLPTASAAAWQSALAESGSSIFTLGFRSSDAAIASVINVTAAATGMVVVALFIAYLPTLYAAVRERERFVKLIEGRLRGRPLSGADLLLAHFERGTDQLLVDLYRDAERWAVDVVETHTKYPVLLHFRAPRAPLNWLDTLTAVADAAELHRLIISEPPQETLSVSDAIELCLAGLARVAHVAAEPHTSIPSEAVEAVVEELQIIAPGRIATLSTDTEGRLGHHRARAAGLAKAIGNGASSPS